MHNRPFERAQRAAAVIAVALCCLAFSSAVCAEESATEIVEAAAKAHGSPPAAADGSVSLHARMSLELTTPEGDRVQLVAERKFLAPPGDVEPRIWTQVRDGDRTTVRAFDGTTPWTRLADGRVQSLVDAEYAEDRSQLLEDIALTRQLARLFQLDRLTSELKELTRLPDEDGAGKTAHVVEGVALERNEDVEQRMRIRLWIDTESNLLLGCRITTEGPDAGPPIDLCFWNYRDTESGLKVPREIKIHRSGDEKPMQVIRLSRLDLAAKLQDADFVPPR